jgi:hypothetical protein
MKIYNEIAEYIDGNEDELLMYIDSSQKFDGGVPEPVFFEYKAEPECRVAYYYGFYYSHDNTSQGYYYYYDTVLLYTDPIEVQKNRVIMRNDYTGPHVKTTIPKNSVNLIASNLTLPVS